MRVLCKRGIDIVNIGIGDKVKNTRDGKYGIAIRIFKDGSIAVLENVAPTIINTHDSNKTLKLIEKQCIDIFDETK